MDETNEDVLLTNTTCAIRNKAEQKVWQRLRLLKKGTNGQFGGWA
jgi:tRNA A37 methylthiotransferase MiaB